MEIRIYKIKAGLQREFVDFFCNEAAPAQVKAGMFLKGPFIGCTAKDRVVCFRLFRTPEERENVRRRFYQGSEWRDKLKERASRIVESHDVVVIDVPDLIFDQPFETMPTAAKAPVGQVALNTELSKGDSEPLS